MFVIRFIILPQLIPSTARAKTNNAHARHKVYSRSAQNVPTIDGQQNNEHKKTRISATIAAIVVGLFDC